MGSIPEIREGAQAGVWSGSGVDATKLASVGIHVEGRVVLHGMALNSYETPESFAGIRLCGLDAQPGFLLTSPDLNRFAQLGETLKEEALFQFWSE
jgi:lipoate-protein ligase B